MPTTVNGIGTHYYGQKNLQMRPGVCRSCQRQVNLVSYDTRLWFVVVFIPIIPLGRKRIIDSCPACRRHFVADLHKWESAKQLEISGAIEEFRNDPTPEKAIAAHRQLLAFHQMNEAAALQKTMCERFPDNANIHAYLGEALSAFGRVSEAEPLYARALQLRPDLPEARIGVALTYIRRQRLDDARQLLEFLEKPGSAQLYSLSPLESLALAYQKAGRHQEALVLLGRLLSELPALADHKGFRKTIQKSESALNKSVSILPRAKFSLGKFFTGMRGAAPAGGRSVSGLAFVLILAGIAAVIGLSIYLANEYGKRHRTVYVVNQFGPDLRLSLTGVGPVALKHGLNTVTVPDGRYHASFSGPVDDQADFTIQGGGNTVWVLNPGGAAMLEYQEVVYSENPRPGTFSFRYGHTFEQFRGVTHPFKKLPDRVTTEQGENSKTLTSVNYYDGKPLNVAFTFQNLKRYSEAVDIAEWGLTRDPDDREMLVLLLESGGQAKALKRVELFLHAGISNRPVHIEWHRMYQQLALAGTNASSMMGEYESMLDADPANAALMYLLGRVCDNRQRSTNLYAQSHLADPTSPYPLNALAFDRALEGDWASAKELLDQVRALRPDDNSFTEQWLAACIALGRFDEAETAMHARLAKRPADISATDGLCEVLAAEGKRAEGETAISNLARAIQKLDSKIVDEIRNQSEWSFHYALGDFAALEKEARAGRDTEAGKASLFYALAEQGRVDEAARIYARDEITAPEAMAALGLACQLAGNAAQAEEWRNALVKNYRTGTAKGRRIADLLAGVTAPTPQGLDDFDNSVELKATVAAWLAITHPTERDWLNALARKLNASRSFPHHLVDRATRSSAR